jgi:hypothetical protein
MASASSTPGTRKARKTTKAPGTRKARKAGKPRPTQLTFNFRATGRGGWRQRAGRKKKPDAGVSHQKRPTLASRHPVHVVLEVDQDLPNLRSPKLTQIIEERFQKGRQRFGFRLVHYSIQRHHIHLIVEAACARSLSKGMQGLAIRLAKGINKALGRRGRVFIDRYFERILTSPKQVRHCLAYVLNNGRRHAAQRGQVRSAQWVDPCASGHYFDGWDEVWFEAPSGRDPPVARARTWLLRVGWRRHGLIGLAEVPGGRR